MKSLINSKHLGRRPALWLALLLILGLALVACQEEATPTPPPAVVEEVQPPAPEATEAPAEETAEEPPEPVQLPVGQLDNLTDELWVLVGYGDAMNPDVVETGVVVTAVFGSDGTLAGSGGCNNYSGSYEADDNGGISVGPLATTRMACKPAAMDTENAYLAALVSAEQYAINEEGRLEILYDSGANFEEKLVYTAGLTPLENTEWLLVSYGDPEEPQAVAAGTAVTAVFIPESEGADNGIIGGVATCNNYSLPYTITSDSPGSGQLTVMPGPVTLMACPLAPEQESTYLAALGTAESYQIQGAQLEISYADGVLVYTSLNLPLENTLWRATFLNGQLVPEEVEITALFVEPTEVDAGRVSGIAACNNYTGGFTVDGENITVSETATTRKFCEEPLNQLEQEYLATLQGSETYRILGDQLTLESADGFIVYQADRQPLQGTLWSLVSLGTIAEPQEPAEGSDFTAIFLTPPGSPTGIMAGTTGCNDYNAAYAANLNEIKINLPSKSNNEDCPWGAGNFEVEQQFFLGLNAADSYTILGNELRIVDTDSEQLFVFRATELPVEEGLTLAPLNGTFWWLVSVDDQALIPGSEITAQFAVNDDGQTGQISGSSGCNNYNAPISVESGAFSVGPVISTLAACTFPPGVMEQEQAYQAALQTASGYSIVGEQLLIPTDAGVLTYSATQPEPTLDQTTELQNITWYMLSYEQLTPVQFAEPTAFFDASGAVSGNTGCNDYSGVYATEPGNKLTISSVSTTRAACTSDALTQQESGFTTLMQSATNYLVSGNQLSILTVDGGVMNFTSVPPAGPAGPTAVINATTSAKVGETVTFDGSASVAGSSPIVSYEWNLGDGSKASGAIVQYAYADAGTYNVSLTVTDQFGLSNNTSQSISITAAPTPDVPPTAAIQGPSAVGIGEQATFTAAGSTAGSAAISKYIWNFGDGNTTETKESTATTVYAQAGVYQVSVTVVDANNLSDSASTSISVNASLQGMEWLLNNTIQGTSISVVFGNGSLSGFGGCNSYSGAYTADATASSGNMSISGISSTGALCSEEISQQEAVYLADLGTVTSFAISGNQLTLTSAGGGLVYRGVPVASIYQ